MEEEEGERQAAAGIGGTIQGHLAPWAGGQDGAIMMAQSSGDPLILP